LLGLHHTPARTVGLLFELWQGRMNKCLLPGKQQ